jgi:voltage-gated sodium channel
LTAALAQVMPRLYAIAALMSLVFYIFSVLFTELFGELKLSNNYFGTLDLSLYTCMQMMTLEWADLCREVMLVLPWAWVPFLVFIAFSGFVVFNLIVAVVCDAVKLVDAQSRARDQTKSPEVLKRERQVIQAEELQKHVSSMKDDQSKIDSAISILMDELIGMDQDVLQARARQGRTQ